MIRMKDILVTRNMARYVNKASYNGVPQTLSLNTEVSFIKNKIKKIKSIPPPPTSDVI